MLPLAAQVALLLLTAVAAWFDWRERRIPNWLVGVGAIAAVGFLVAYGTWRSSLAGAGIALVIYLVLWRMGAVGAGDAKLMAVVGAFLGPVLWFAVFAATHAISGIWGVIRDVDRNPHAVAIFVSVGMLLAYLALR